MYSNIGTSSMICSSSQCICSSQDYIHGAGDWFEDTVKVISVKVRFGTVLQVEL